MVRVQLVGGPTALLEVGGLRLLTDPTFDEPGSFPRPNGPTLVKLAPPAVSPDELGPVDAVLLSHDQHADNLDNSGRALLRSGPADVHDRHSYGPAVRGEVTGFVLTATDLPAIYLSGDNAVVPVHYTGWQHFTEGEADLRAAFERAGIADRLC